METLTITSGVNNVEIEINGGLSINGTKRMSIRKANVVKLRLVDNPQTMDMIKIHYCDGDSDEIHFTRVTDIDGATPTSNDDLYNRLDAIFNA